MPIGYNKTAKLGPKNFWANPVRFVLVFRTLSLKKYRIWQRIPGYRAYI
jgi:hypothetical protein